MKKTQFRSDEDEEQVQEGGRRESFYQTLGEEEYNCSFMQMEQDGKRYEKIEMLEREKFIIQQAFLIKDIEKKIDTELFLTNYRIIIVHCDPISIPYGDRYLRLQLKTGTHIDIFADRDHLDMKAYIELGMNQLPFCMKQVEDKEKPFIYDSWAEVERMRVDSQNYKVYKNQNLKFCSSYPPYFLIPKTVKVQNLSEVKKCRFNGRIPVMSFFSDQSGVGIWRASFLFKHLLKENIKYDVAYLHQISKDLIIIRLDTPLNPENPFSFRSLKQLKLSFHALTQTYLNSLNSQPSLKTEPLLKVLGKWYQQINKLIRVAYHIVKLIEVLDCQLQTSKHVLVQQMLSFDRVPQIIALCQIIIDPFYRTFDGLSILIQKQFINFGHPFESRCGFKQNRFEQSSPIFIQFLECIHHLIATHPQNFEYSSAYLAKIGYQIYTTKYRNFLDRIANVLSDHIVAHSQLQQMSYLYLEQINTRTLTSQFPVQEISQQYGIVQGEEETFNKIVYHLG